MDFKNFQIRVKEPLGNPDCPYAYRWAILMFGYGIRLHHWIGSDDDRAYHDHPWWMLIFCLKGGYWDIHPPFVSKVEPLHFYFRQAEWKHRVKLTDNKDTWTLLFTGPKIRNWGFYIPGRDKLMRPLRYFHRYGHHQCDK